MKKLLAPLYIIYHTLWAIGSAIFYWFPSRKIYIIGVTGTKGKSSTVEMINQILETAGFKTAVAGTIRFKIGNQSEPNLFKMSMPGRGFLQKFLHQAVNAGCKYAVIEMTSEGAKQNRHLGIELDALIFTNLSPEHIESHGSYEKYRAAKLKLAKALARSRKPNKIFVGNGDDLETKHFLSTIGSAAEKILFKLNDWEEIPEPINLPLPGNFNKYNALAAINLTQKLGVPLAKIKQALENFSEIKGRVQKVYAATPELRAKQNFDVIVDYAHTADSMKQLLETFPNQQKICVFGATGGGRDHWKREVMGKVADIYCDQIILTDDDSYDEDPAKIAAEVAKGISKQTPQIIIDRREAIATAIKSAQAKNLVLLIGKGTDPFLMGPNGQKTPWSDAKIAEEEIDKTLENR